MKNLKLQIIKYVFFTLVFFMAIPVFASEFSFITDSKTVFVGQQFKIDLNLNTKGESINALEGKIFFPPDLIEFSEIRVGNSIVNFWIEKPVYQDGHVIFSGVIPGGYTFDKGLVLSVILKAKQEGNTFIKIEDGNTLLNDGNGTQSALTISNLEMNILSARGVVEEPVIKIVDQELPDTFKPEISQDPNLFANQWFVVFVAQDKGSGIKKYEIRESKYRFFNFSRWIEAESPYVLTDQNLTSNIFVKAVDNSGNERIIRLSPANPIIWYTNLENWFIIVIVVIVMLLSFIIFKKFLYK